MWLALMPLAATPHLEIYIVHGVHSPEKPDNPEKPEEPEKSQEKQIQVRKKP